MNDLGAVDLLAERDINTRWGIWHERLFRHRNDDIVAMSSGVPSSEAEVLVRIHSSCFSAQYLYSTECDCREQLELTFERMAAAGGGIIIFLDQDGRGNGHVGLMRAAVIARERRLTQSEAYEQLGYAADARGYRGAGLVLGALGLTAVRLLTNNRQKVAAVEMAGIVVTREQLVIGSDGLGRAQYYADKALEGYLRE